MFCKECGNEIEAGDKFCLNCGARVEEIEPPVPAPESAPPAAEPAAAQPEELSAQPIPTAEPLPPLDAPQQRPVQKPAKAVAAAEKPAEPKKQAQPKKPRPTLGVSPGAKAGLMLLHLIPTVMCIAAIVLWFCEMFTVRDGSEHFGVSAAAIAQDCGVGILTTIVVALYAVTGLYCLIPIIAKSVSKPRTPVLQIIVSVFALELCYIAYCLAETPYITRVVGGTLRLGGLYWAFAGVNVCLLIVPCITATIIHRILMRAVGMQSQEQ